MNISWITVLYNTSQIEIGRLQKEIHTIDAFINLILVDNSNTKKGYAHGVNEGIKQAVQENTDVVIISNPDISVAQLSKESIVELANQFDIGGFAMRQNGTIYTGGVCDKWRMSAGLITEKPATQFQSVDFVSGSLMVIQKKVIETIGLFDESYGMYYEDVDYCIRARKAGFTVGIDSQHLYDHFETSDENPQKKYFLAKNRLKILLHYGSWKQKLYELLRIPKTIYEYFR